MSDIKKYEVALAKVREWLSDGCTWVGCFENADLGHPNIGQRILLPYDDDVFEKAELRKTPAPDSGSYGLGWRYLLEMKTRDAVEAARWMLRLDEPRLFVAWRDVTESSAAELLAAAEGTDLPPVLKPTTNGDHE